MTTECLERPAIAYRNFNVCPHCQSLGQPPFLSRLCESVPMISRSDGSTYHLFLADRPLPYPNERSAGRTQKISAFFWYNHVSRPHAVGSALVTLRSTQTNQPGVFRAIEVVADLLAETLARDGQLKELYDFRDDALLDLSQGDVFRSVRTAENPAR
jgi:hypothetical protein